jgi:putative transposase
MNKSFRYRLEPTTDQERKLRQFAGARRFIWNWALGQRRDHYRTTGKGLPGKELSKRLTALKNQPETAWLREMDSQLLQQALADVQRAYVNYFEGRARRPRFKSRKRDKVRFRIPQRVRVAGNAVVVPKIGQIRLRLSRPVDGTTKSATFRQDAYGQWYVSLVVDASMPNVTPPLPDPAHTVGLDLGLGDVVVPTDAPKVPAPRFYRKARRRLRRAQRVHSRRKKGSHNREKARCRVARIHQRVANQRAHFCHDLTTKLIKNHQAVCIEDLNVRGLARTKLATSFYDAALGQIRRQLLYKGQWYGVHVVGVDRFFPSTQLCSVCGSQNRELTLADRTWTCPRCGTVHDRDMNAAINVKNEGLRLLAVGHTESLNACGAGVRPARSWQTASKQESHRL